MSENQFSDPIDRASYIADVANREAEEHYRRLAAPEQVKGADGKWETEECVDCGEDIEPQRLEMGKVRCIACQTIKEKREKNYARY
jgi:RNA polymerase-binding transcription factor DksA